MRKIKFLFCIIITLSLAVSCAKRGSITGGDKDVTPPKIVSSYPENFSKDFNTNTIKINFDEYIKIKDLQKNLVVSPLMKTPLTVLPQGSASKQMIIKINDTLQPNTTYSFNFGPSITDNNEGNPIKQFKYVFSTGKELDSLTVEGFVKDSYEKVTDKYVNVMLYEVDDTFTDSIIYKQTPRYITNTLDSTTTFKLDNVKAGKYKLIALKEKAANYKFDPTKDKIAFYNQTITVPDPSIFELELFKEVPAFKAHRPSQASGNRLLLGYEGNPKDVIITATRNQEKVQVISTKLTNKDSLQLWFQPLKNDSLKLTVSNKGIDKIFALKTRELKQDSLKITAKTKGIVGFNDKFILHSETPLTKFDESKIRLTKKDSSTVQFKKHYDVFHQDWEFLFDKEPNEKYTLTLLPEATEDYLGQKNDTLTFQVNTKSLEDYGNLKLNLKNAKSLPVIVELTNEKGETIVSKYTETTLVEFLLLEPQKYSLRVIYDENKNQQRDTGNYLENRQPEEVYHFPNEIDLRANWDVNQEIDLGK
ncbi:Ig-like domain-containing protein [Flavobacterium luminosum]|uniref:Ig-like domain-containing protein n=1 Tax=Flavobacterium luminosum TaxID=2949086 RepID=A0ABT0TMU5_9FLAO|nr:Ig-like domain-containing protein [Flavobacterium sp. HXWNR70]MCL9808213.1 Ig-like domain-containing protein [Flavobacterium sp. HXWNR70]